jgi:hypothetical protein
MPDGPKSNAITFVRIIPNAMLNAADPPINADDFKISPYDLFGIVETGVSALSDIAGKSAAASLHGPDPGAALLIESLPARPNTAPADTPAS